ncbi:hypothetical protein RB653_000888 [Dictyostelium firmibasis]|uniref:Uncharacterized protein n=1 Tax=Dictyostelium firmibasis TaxID=79012 RepID=A0AAN7YR07_9MYCE
MFHTTKELLDIIENLKKENEDLKSKLSAREKLNKQKTRRIKNKKIVKGDSDDDDDYDDGDDNDDDDDDDYEENSDSDIDMKFDSEKDIDKLMKELESKKYVTVAKIAKSKYGVELGGKKSDILNRIRNSIKQKDKEKKQEKIKDKKQIKNNNSKQQQEQLKNKLPMDENEKLFWKVFRNKYLNRQIVDKLCTGKHSLRYDEIFNVNHMIGSNEIELLKDKVNTNQYLTGFSTSLVNLFQSIKDDKKFYSNLFKFYPKFSLFNIDYTISNILATDFGDQVKISNQSESYSLLFDSFRFGDFKLFEQVVKSTLYDSFRYTSYGFSAFGKISKIGNTPILFQFQNNKENQIQFIIDICSYLNLNLTLKTKTTTTTTTTSTTSTTIKKKIEEHSNHPSYIFFNQVLLYGNLEFIEIAYNLLKKPLLEIEDLNNQDMKRVGNFVFESHNFHTEFFFIRSLDVLEFVFNNCLKDNTKVLPITDFIYNGRLDLVEKYHSLLSSSSSKEIPLVIPKPPKKLLRDFCSMKLVLKTIREFLQSPVSEGKGYHFTNDHFLTFQDVKSVSDFSFIFNHKSMIHTSKIRHDSQNYYFKIGFERWSFFYRNTKPNETKFTIYWHDYFGIGYMPKDLKPKEIFNTIENCKSFIDNVMNVCLPNFDDPDTITPSDITFCGTDFICYLHGLLEKEARIGHIRLFKALVENGYKLIFLKKSDITSKGIFNQLQLRTILYGALLNDHLELSLFLLNVCNITISDTQFNSNVKKKSATFYNLKNLFSKNEIFK